MKRGKIEGSAMDSRMRMRDKSEDDFEGGKPQLWGPVRSRCSTNCSSTFAKIDIPLPLKFVDQHLLDSKLVASTPLNPMQPLFPMWYNPNKRFEYHRRISDHLVEQLQEFQESSLEDSEREASWISERWVIGHIIPQKSSEWQVIENA